MRELDLLRSATQLHLGMDPDDWIQPDLHGHVAMCILDSIYSTMNHYNTVLKLLQRYRESRAEEGADADGDGPRDLISAFERWGGPEGFVQKTGYRLRTSTAAGAPYKAYAALCAAQVVSADGLLTVEDLRRAFPDFESQVRSGVKKEWLRIPGQRSGLTWNYFLMLAGVPGVKADRMVLRFVEEALGRSADQQEATELLGLLADELGISRTRLDHAVWRKASGRPHLTSDSRYIPRG